MGRFDRSRSTSIGSNSSTVSDTSKLSNSPLGFWYVKPGSYSNNNSWSPTNFVKKLELPKLDGFPQPPLEDFFDFLSPLKGLVRSQSYSAFSSEPIQTDFRSFKDQDYEKHHLYS